MSSPRCTAERRVATLGRHVVPRLEGESLSRSQGVGMAPTASSSTYASATGRPTSYARVHGEVSREPAEWTNAKVPQGELEDVIYQKTPDGIAKSRSLAGSGDLAFCSGGDQAVRGEGGYVGEDGTPRLNVLDLQVSTSLPPKPTTYMFTHVGPKTKSDSTLWYVWDSIVLQVQIRRLPKPVVCMVAGYAVGGGHILHMVCDLTIAADNAVFGQTGPKASDISCRPPDC
eukprot:9214303-Pyramimonas_sp.AAC.2